MKIKIILAVFILTFLTVSCISQQKTTIDVAPDNPYKCLGYFHSDKSEYNLPYPIDTNYILVQGNCTRYSHHGFDRYAYDFGIPIGREITASRSGTVISVDMNHYDHKRRGKRKYRHIANAKGNSIFIEHSDGTVAAYFHLKQNSAIVEKGDMISQGQVIALGGNSGFTTGPHLHFEVRRSRDDRQTIPITFKNADPGEDFNLKSGNRYFALAIK